MSIITIAKDQLNSRIVRSEVSRGQNRKIDLSNRFVPPSNNALERIWNGATTIVGFVHNFISGIRISAEQAVGWCRARWEEFVNFNWNSTDEELNQSMRQQYIALAEIWGEVAGVTLGSVKGIAVGAGIAMMIPYVGGTALAKMVIADALPEVLEEIGGAFLGAIRQTIGIFIRQALTSSYINVRRLIKAVPRNALTRVFGDELGKKIADHKDLWGTEAAPRFTISQGVEDKVESIPNPYARAFVEGFLDEFYDSFVEAGFIVARSIDQRVAEARAAVKKERGQDRTVVIQPDKRINESFPVTGKEEEIKSQIQGIIHNARMVHNKDIGQVVGTPAEDWYRARVQRRKLLIVFKTVEAPPYYVRGRSIRTAEYSIPDIKATVTWNQIKRACRAYEWGRFRATANLDNGRQMAVYGASAQIAEDKLKEMAELSEANILSLSVSEEKERPRRLRKEAMMMYPAYGTVLVRTPSNYDGDMSDLHGDNWQEEHIRFALWTDDEPEEWAFVRLQNHIPAPANQE